MPNLSCILWIAEGVHVWHAASGLVSQNKPGSPPSSIKPDAYDAILMALGMH